MKTLVIPDLHGKSIWKLMVHMEKPDRVVFLGDYYDCFEQISTAEQIYNYKEIVKLKTDGEMDVVILIGNHDLHYFPEIGYNGCSGYQKVGKWDIEPVMNETRDLVQMTYEMDGYLFTHAGVSQEFMDQTFGVDGWKTDQVAELLNEKFKYQPHTFEFNGIDGYGDDTYQTPLWIRPKSLMKANKKSDLKKNFIQIVGHTGVMEIDKKGASTAGKYYFVDTLNTSQEYIVIENGNLTFKKINNGKEKN